MSNPWWPSCLAALVSAEADKDIRHLALFRCASIQKKPPLLFQSQTCQAHFYASSELKLKGANAGEVEACAAHILRVRKTTTGAAYVFFFNLSILIKMLLRDRLVTLAVFTILHGLSDDLTAPCELHIIPWFVFRLAPGCADIPSTRHHD